MNETTRSNDASERLRRDRLGDGGVDVAFATTHPFDDEVDERGAGRVERRSGLLAALLMAAKLSSGPRAEYADSRSHAGGNDNVLDADANGAEVLRPSTGSTTRCPPGGCRGRAAGTTARLPAEASEVTIKISWDGGPV